MRGIQFGVDRVKYTARAMQNVVVPEAEDGKTLRTQKGVAPAVVLAFGMLRSVSLDDEPSLETDEIDDVRLDNELPLEPERGHSAVPEHRP